MIAFTILRDVFGPCISHQKPDSVSTFPMFVAKVVQKQPLVHLLCSLDSLPLCSGDHCSYKCELPTLHTNSCGLIGLGYCFTDVLTNSTDTICVPFAVAALFTNYHEMSRKPLRAYTPPSAGDSALRQSLDLQ